MYVFSKFIFLMAFTKWFWTYSLFDSLTTKAKPEYSWLTFIPASSESESCKPRAAFCNFFLALASSFSVSSKRKPFPLNPLLVKTFLPSYRKTECKVPFTPERRHFPTHHSKETAAWNLSQTRILPQTTDGHLPNGAASHFLVDTNYSVLQMAGVLTSCRTLKGRMRLPYANLDLFNIKISLMPKRRCYLLSSVLPNYISFFSDKAL